jgi:hypothetical protein
VDREQTRSDEGRNRRCCDPFRRTCSPLHTLLLPSYMQSTQGAKGIETCGCYTQVAVNCRFVRDFVLLFAYIPPHALPFSPTSTLWQRPNRFCSRRHHPRSPRVRTRRPHDHLPRLRLRCTRRCTASSPSSNSGRIVLHLPLYPLLRSQMPLLRSSRSLSILLRRTVSPHLSLIPGCDVVDDGVRTWSRGTTGRVNRSLLPPTHPTLLPSLHSCTRVGWGARTSRSLRSRT